MKLSDTKNPKNGQPFTFSQLQAGAMKHCIVWKKDNSENPELSDCLTAAVNRIGWENPDKTLHLASVIEREMSEARTKQKLIDYSRVHWNGSALVIDGERISGNSNTVISVLEKNGIAVEIGINGKVREISDSLAGRGVGQISDSVVAEVLDALKAESDKLNKIAANPIKIQTWGGSGNSPEYI